MADALDPRTPVLVGGGQISQRVDRGADPLEPVDLMAEALRCAADDSGSARLLGAADAVWVLRTLSWHYDDPAALVAERVGASPKHTAHTVMGGNYPQTLVNKAALAIASGQAEVVLIAGAEAWRTRSAARASNTVLAWTPPSGGSPSETFGEHDPELSSPGEMARGVFLPVQLYPIFDVARRAALGLGIDEHRQRIAELWSGFSEVAATNPHAWINEPLSAEQIATASPSNRMIGFPYTKVMNSNNSVEQGAAVVVCSAERAEALGIDRDRWVFLHAGTDAHDHWWVSQRDRLDRSPAIRIAGRRALELAGTDVDGVAHVDLYSCFPSAVQIAADELGLGLDRQLTVTGGMSFAGGPWNNYVTHSIATMLDTVRADPGSLGLVTGNGGYLTKHAFGIYSTEPPAGGYRYDNPQAAVDATPARQGDDTYAGPAEIESYTVVHDRDGATDVALVALRTPGGDRTWGRCADQDAMAAMETEEWVGRPVDLDDEGAVTVG